MFGAIFGFIAVLIATIVMFTVGNTMNMAVMERTHEIGTLRAIGVRGAGIRRMFVCEDFLLGVCGAALGTLLVFGASFLINRAQLHWTPPGQTEPMLRPPRPSPAATGAARLKRPRRTTRPRARRGP
ncbi:ftsX-like permease family protein [Burkholderia thailandensis MSMB121]|uniref:ABC transporter permease n=1 Tax=Burkholderia TaxID=32008 RepID=UPI000327FCE7|nr:MULTISPECIES: FtsX-like permease family protein [Burkholderia]AGK51100.1 ftsX-like permease family protein [Burkholderia thailandensis MSMB121]ATF32807.1 cell division protein FtsX [Burkholderia thailandensis]KST71014.1 cell division protein FtsX [Burkholderia humptydooensis]